MRALALMAMCAASPALGQSLQLHVCATGAGPVVVAGPAVVEPCRPVSVAALGLSTGRSEVDDLRRQLESLTARMGRLEREVISLNGLLGGRRTTVLPRAPVIDRFDDTRDRTRALGDRIDRQLDALSSERRTLGFGR